MVKRYKRSSPASMAKFEVEYLEQRDDEVMQALLAAGIFVARADGRVELSECDELLNFIDRQGFAPRSSRRDISEALDSSMRQQADGKSLSTTIEMLQPIAGLALSSVVVRTPERVATADGELHALEADAIQIIRQVLLKSTSTPPVASRTRH